jgi:Peptidase family S41/PDZ domain
MRTIRNLLLLLASLAPACFGQLTTDQKVFDFTQLSSLYAKNYAPYEWKRDVIKFDLMNIKPWLDRVKSSKDDIEFYDLCVQYVASLQDSHDEFTLPSDFIARMSFDLDIYDGKVLIDSISRTLLPIKDFPFVVGDELISVDGTPVEDLIKSFIPYAVNGSANASTRRRLAADTISFRFQGYFPRAHLIGDSSIIVVQGSDGKQNSYTIPWTKSGTPILQAGRVPSPITAVKKRSTEEISRDLRIQRNRTALSFRGSAGEVNDDQEDGNPWGVWTGEPMEREVEIVPEYLKPLRELQVSQALDSPLGAAGFGAATPVFNPPTGFRTRLGSARTDLFLSGTFPLGQSQIGFIRIPTMSPASTTTAMQQFAAEIAYFNANTDALVIDVMRNGGGSLCYIEQLSQYLFTTPFRGSAYEMRATQFWVQVFSSQLNLAKALRSDQWVIDLYTVYLAEVQKALSENRGCTGSIPICTPNFEDISPAKDNTGKILAYTKPILLLVDEFSLSAAEAFSMFLQDQGRATVFGVRTDGGGGNPGSYNATTFSEGSTRVTRTFVTRPRAVTTPGFPAANHMENVGVYPDIINDYMTRDNLLSGGKAFVAAFTSAVSDLIAMKP